MNPKPLRLLLAVLIAASAVPPVRAQSKAERRAEKLASKDSDFKSLPPDEQRAVILFLAKEISEHRRKAIEANIRTIKGTDVKDLEKSIRNKDILVLAEQDKEAVNIPPGPSTIEVKSIDTPVFHRLFQNNKWKVNEGSPEAAQLKQTIDNVVDTLKKTGGKLVSMHVESSASTLRNREDAEKMTHMELSMERAKDSARYAREYLQTKGITLEDEQVTLDYDGSNHNGTSGPSSPFAVPDGDDPKFNPQGCCKPPEEAVKIASHWKTATDAEKAKLDEYYGEFRYVQLTFDAMFETKSGTPGVSKPGEAHAVTAYLNYKDKPEWPKIRIRLPRIHIGWPFGNKERRMARRQTRCPKW